METAAPGQAHAVQASLEALHAALATAHAAPVAEALSAAPGGPQAVAALAVKCRATSDALLRLEYATEARGLADLIYIYICISKVDQSTCALCFLSRPGTS